MAYQLHNKLVVGISSRALFDLEEENAIYETLGLQAYQQYQLDNEHKILRPGSGFAIVKALLQLNTYENNETKVEIIVMSRNSADTSLRIFNSLAHYQLPISRAALSGGAKLSSYLKAFKTDLFLSAHEEDVQQAINDGIAAGIIYPHPAVASNSPITQLRIAFDGDAVLFSDDSERIYQNEGLEAFLENEHKLADQPMKEGPFANFLKSLASMQAKFEGHDSPIRTALVTARNAPAHERVVKTLRAWNVRIDEAFFLGGIEKAAVLQSFGAHIFFDDQDVHTRPASELVPSARVPYQKQ